MLAASLTKKRRVDRFSVRIFEGFSAHAHNSPALRRVGGGGYLRGSQFVPRIYAYPVRRSLLEN